MRKNVAFFCFICLCVSYLLPFKFTVGSANLYAEAPAIIKFATLAPKGSIFVNVLHDIDKELQEKSGGRLRLKIYAGGVTGDEKDVIRKMRIGQLHCAGFTGIGLGDILPDVRIFDLPFFFKDYKEVDFIKDRVKDRFSKAFEEMDYVLLGWSEVGFVYFFSNTRIDSLDTLRATKMWVWESDPMANILFSAIKLSPIPLSITDVMTSLQIGLINSVYSSPLASIDLQWFTKVKYMLDLPLADATGAVLMTKKYYDNLSPDLQQILKNVFEDNMERLTPLIREANKRSIEELKRAGIKLVYADETIVKKFEEAGKKTCESLTGQLYNRWFLKEIVNAIEGYRKSSRYAHKTGAN